MTEMDLDRARQIVAACVNHSLFRMGVIEEPPPSLAEYSLGELLEANEMIRAQNDEVDAAGNRKIQIVCDDRLIAALYVLYHYEASELDDIRLIAANAANGVCCLRHEGTGDG
jgi:hypothetical protein